MNKKLGSLIKNLNELLLDNSADIYTWEYNGVTKVAVSVSGIEEYVVLDKLNGWIAEGLEIKRWGALD